MESSRGKIQFFLENCEVKVGSQKVEIIQKNCYSTAAKGNIN